MPAWVGGCSIMHLCCGRRWRSGTVPPLRCGVCLYGALPWAGPGEWDCSAGAVFSWRFSAAHFSRWHCNSFRPCRTAVFVPDAATFAASWAKSSAASPVLSVAYSLGVACRSSIRASAFFLERMKALFMRWPIMADLSGTLMSFVFSRVLILLMAAHLPVFSSSDISVQWGPHSSPYGAGPSTSGPRLCRQRQSQRPAGMPQFPTPACR